MIKGGATEVWADHLKNDIQRHRMPRPIVILFRESTWNLCSEPVRTSLSRYWIQTIIPLQLTTILNLGLACGSPYGVYLGDDFQVHQEHGSGHPATTIDSIQCYATGKVFLTYLAIG